MAESGNDRWWGVLGGSFVLLVGLAFLLPPLVTDRSDGLAAAGTAALTFLFFFFLAAMVAVVLAVRIILRWRDFGGWKRGLGLLPVLLVGAVILGITLKISADARPAASATSPPKPSEAADAPPTTAP